MDDHRRARRNGWILIVFAAGATIAVLGGFVVIGTGLIRGLLPRHFIAVDAEVQLTPDATGTWVTYVERHRSESLPAVLEINLIGVDRGWVDPGTRLTDAQLVYTAARDGEGRSLPADQVTHGRLTVPTDGKVLRVSYHVNSVEGRRVVYLPRAPKTAARTVLLPSIKTNCLSELISDPPSDPGFRECVRSGNTLDSQQNTRPIRLELP